MTQERTTQAEATIDLQNLTLADIYGKYTLRAGTEIITDIPYQEYEVMESDKEAKEKLTAELCAKYNLPAISHFSDGMWKKERANGNLVIWAGIGPKLTEWAPHIEEREIILGLATALSKDRKPFIVDAGCGTGLLSNLLAADGKARVVGVEKDPNELSRTAFREADLITADLYDVYDLFLPEMSNEDRERLRNLMGEIKQHMYDSLRDEPLGETEATDEELVNMYASYLGHNFDFGPMYRFRRQLKHMQTLLRGYTDKSKVDLAICSFMQTGVDLTIPIRDGIFPKAIVYVRPHNGISGLTEFWGRERIYKKNEKLTQYCVSSYNPGSNYRTVAKWPTLWSGNWEHKAWGNSQWMPEAEVIVQLRKDVQMGELQEVGISSYSWDDELLEIMRSERTIAHHSDELKTNFTKDNKFEEEYFQAIRKARKAITSQ